MAYINENSHLTFRNITNNLNNLSGKLEKIEQEIIENQIAVLENQVLQYDYINSMYEQLLSDCEYQFNFLFDYFINEIYYLYDYIDEHEGGGGNMDYIYTNEIIFPNGTTLSEISDTQGLEIENNASHQTLTVRDGEEFAVGVQNGPMLRFYPMPDKYESLVGAITVPWNNDEHSTEILRIMVPSLENENTYTTTFTINGNLNVTGTITSKNNPGSNEISAKND